MPDFTIRSTKTEVTQVLNVVKADTAEEAIELFNDYQFDNGNEQQIDTFECSYADAEVLT